MNLPQITQPRTQELSARYVFQRGWMTNIAWSADGKCFAISGPKGPTIYRLNDLKHPRLLTDINADPLRDVLFHNVWLYSGGDDATIWRWHMESLEHEVVFNGHKGQINSLVAHPTGSLFASGGKDEEVYLWNTQGIQHRLADHTREITCIRFSPDGRWLATASWDTAVRIYDSGAAHLVSILEGHTDRVNEINFSPDGQLLVTTGRDGNVHLWNTSNWQIERSLVGHEGGVDCAMFSADSQIVATGGRDTTVGLWDPATGESLAVLRGHRKPIVALAFNPAGTLLATCGGEHLGVIWGIRDDVE